MLLTRAVQGGRSSAGDELSQREAPGKRHGGASFHEAWRWDRSVFSTHGYLLAGFCGYSYHMQPCFTSADRSRIAAALIGTQMCWFIFAYLSDILQTQVGSGNLTEPPKNSSVCKKNKIKRPDMYGLFGFCDLTLQPRHILGNMWITLNSHQPCSLIKLWPINKKPWPRFGWSGAVWMHMWLPNSLSQSCRNSLLNQCHKLSKTIQKTEILETGKIFIYRQKVQRN